MKAKKTAKYIFIVLILITTISCDQIAKNAVRKNIDYNTRIQVIPNRLILTKVENTGVFLGLGDSVPRPVYILLMIIVPLLVIGYASYYLVKKNQLSVLVIIGISCIIGGGIGNIIDRIRFGSVTDFLIFDFGIFHTGVVNLADIAVTVGFFLLLYELYFKRRKIKPKTTVQ